MPKTLSKVAVVLGSALAAFGLSITALPQSALSAGSVLHIEQKSPIGDFGHWLLTMPSNATFRTALKTKVLNNLDAGTYTLDVTSPAGAQTVITVMNGSQERLRTVGNSATFDVNAAESLRVTITYQYTGNVRVLSEPTGIPFEMKDASGEVYTGTTPAMFTEMAPVWYRVQYAVEESCEVQEDQQRELVAASTLTFWADFNCGDREIPIAGRTTQTLGTSQQRPLFTRGETHEDMPDNRVLQTSSMSEVVPGGRVKFTVAVTNATRGTIHNVVVTDAFDPAFVDIIMPIANGGVIADNEIIWEVPFIYSGQTWETSFYVKAHESLVAGDRIVLTARATSDETDFYLYPQAWSSTVGVGVAYMPQTGKTLELALILGALVGTGLITNLTNRRKKLVEVTV